MRIRRLFVVLSDAPDILIGGDARSFLEIPEEGGA